jgi:predicted Zn-dependent peptidase
LYVVGDVEPSEVEKTIKDQFYHLTAEKQGSEIKLAELKVENSKLANTIVDEDEKT